VTLVNFFLLIDHSSDFPNSICIARASISLLQRQCDFIVARSTDLDTNAAMPDCIGHSCVHLMKFSITTTTFVFPTASNQRKNATYWNYDRSPFRARIHMMVESNWFNSACSHTCLPLGLTLGYLYYYKVLGLVASDSIYTSTLEQTLYTPFKNSFFTETKVTTCQISFFTPQSHVAVTFHITSVSMVLVLATGSTTS
jgi:hypothetical protein